MSVKNIIHAMNDIYHYTFGTTSISTLELNKKIEDAYKSTLDNLTTSEASSLIRSLQQAA